MSNINNLKPLTKDNAKIYGKKRWNTEWKN